MCSDREHLHSFFFFRFRYRLFSFNFSFSLEIIFLIYLVEVCVCVCVYRRYEWKGVREEEARRKKIEGEDSHPLAHSAGFCSGTARHTESQEPNVSFPYGQHGWALAFSLTMADLEVSTGRRGGTQIQVLQFRMQAVQSSMLSTKFKAHSKKIF